MSALTETALETLRAADCQNFLAEDVADLCDAEKWHIHALSPLYDSAWKLAQGFPRPAPEQTFGCGHGRMLKLFPDGSLYVDESGDAEVWGYAGDFFQQTEREPFAYSEGAVQDSSEINVL
ncbi:MAG: hypothetical protein WCL24_08380 [Verrucomicrobiota bacterium]